ncbi:MAG: P-loop NTPase fold protein [Ancrocorticia sp.]
MAFVNLPGGPLLASSGNDGTIRLWNPTTGKQIHKLTGHTTWVNALAFTTTPEGPLLASGDTDGTIRLWNPDTGELIHLLDGHTTWVNALAFTTTPDGPLLASGDAGGTIRLWNPDTGELIHLLDGHTTWVNALAFTTTPDGPLLASGDTDGTIRLWNPTTGKQIHELTGHAGSVPSLAFATTPDGLLLASGDAGGTIRLWNPTTGELIRKLDGHPHPVHSLAFATTPDGLLLASGGFDGTVRLWNPTTGKQIHELTGHTGSVPSLAFATTPDGLLLASGGFDGTVRLWNPTTGKQIHELTGHAGSVPSLAFATTPDGLLLASGGFDGTVRLWNPTTGKQIHELTGHADPVHSLAFATTPDGLLLASGGFDGTIRLWNPTTGELIRKLDGHPRTVHSLAFTTINGRVILASGGENITIRIWNPTTGKQIHELTGHAGPVHSLTFATTPDGPLLASGGFDGTIRLRNPTTGKQIHELTGHTGPVNSLAFTSTSEGPLLASGDADGTIRLWNPTTGKQIHELTGHAGSVHSLAFTTINGRVILASGGNDGTIRLWNPDTGKQIHELTGHTSWVLSLASITTDAQPLLASGGSNGSIVIWRIGSVAEPPEAPSPGSPPGSASSLSTLALSSHDDKATRTLLNSEIPIEQPDAGINQEVSLEGIYPKPAEGPRTDSLPSSDDESTENHHDGTILDDQPKDEIDQEDSPEDSPPDPAPPLSTHAFPSRDDELTEDLLGREILAGHLEGVLNQLVASQGGDDRTQGTVVVNIDGRWGSGKSVLAKLTADRLAETDDGKSREPGEEATEEPASDDRIAETPPLADPIVVWFNAWQQSTVGPRWWTLISQVKRQVEKERALPSRLLLRSVETFARLFRSKAQIFAGLVILAVTTFLLWSSFDTADNSTWDKVIETIGKWDQVGKVLGGIAAFAVILLALGRVLFWTSPTIGKLYLNAESKPLAEVSEILARLRRWAPRQRQRTADRLLAAWFFAVWLPGILTLISTQVSGDSTSSHSSLDGWGLLALLALSVLGVITYCSWLWSEVPTPCKPIVLVIDDLDRCSAEDTVEYLETVHTLMRAGKAPKLFTRWRTPAPFVVLVLADGRWVRTAFERQYQDFVELGDESRRLGADFIQKLFDHTVLVPELNLDQVWDFVDHVTQSSGPRQTARPVETTTATNGDSSRRDVVVATDEGPGQIGENGGGASELPATPETGETLPVPDREGDGDLYQDPSSPDPVANEPGEDTRISPFVPSQPDPLEAARVVKQEADEAEAAASIEETAERTRHLITTYHQILPANPRLIRRVVNTWGMLTALRKHVRHSEEDDTLIRAAVFFVMFPTLTDELLSNKPLISVKDILDDLEYKGPWKHPDVLKVLHTTSGEIDKANLKPEDFLEPRILARCYGRQC